MRTRFHEIRITLGWSMEWLAGHLDIGLTTVRAWNSGRKPVNDLVMAWMERHHARMVADNFPEGFRLDDQDGEQSGTPSQTVLQ